MWHGVFDSEAIFRLDKWNMARFPEAGSEPRANARFPLAALGEICRESRAAVDPQAHPAARFSYLGLENVESHSGILVGEITRSGREIKSKSKVVRQGTVLYGRLRPTLNKVFYVEQPIENGICSGEFLVLVPDGTRVLPRVLRELLASAHVLAEVGRFTAGAALPRISAGDLLDIRIPLPPLDVQREIERGLVELDHRRNRLRRELADVPGQYAGCMAPFWT